MFVKLTCRKLPYLYNKRIFDSTLMIMPKSSNGSSYNVVLGQFKYVIPWPHYELLHQNHFLGWKGSPKGQHIKLDSQTSLTTKKCFIHTSDVGELTADKITITSDTPMQNLASQPTTLEDIAQDVNTTDTMKASNYSKPDLHNKPVRAPISLKTKRSNCTNSS